MTKQKEKKKRKQKKSFNIKYKENKYGFYIKKTIFINY